MKTKHTPGPWRYEGGDNCSIDIILPNDGEIQISRYTRYSDRLAMDRDEMEANALLVSKAPEMLEMLKKVLEVHEHHGFNGHLINDQIKELIISATTI